MKAHSRTTQGNVEFEGTAEEYAEVILLHGGSLDGAPESRADLIRRILRRMDVSDGQKLLYKALYDAGDQGLSYPDLTAAVRTPADDPEKKPEDKLNGILGGLGRRINATEGIEGEPGVELLFDVQRANGVWHYRMRSEFREVLDSEGFDWL